MADLILMAGDPSVAFVPELDARRFMVLAKHSLLLVFNIFDSQVENDLSRAAPRLWRGAAHGGERRPRLRRPRDVLIKARLTADALGATRLDRAEYAAVNPVKGEMYRTLTNNTSGTPANMNATNPRAYTDLKRPSGYKANQDPPSPPQCTIGDAKGHIVRLREQGDMTERTASTWSIWAYGSGADLAARNVNLSGLDDSNDFSSPDGLWFSRPSNAGGLISPLLWVGNGRRSVCGRHQRRCRGP